MTGSISYFEGLFVGYQLTEMFGVIPIIIFCLIVGVYDMIRYNEFREGFLLVTSVGCFIFAAIFIVLMFLL